VAPGSHHPLLQIIEEISNNILAPVRKFMPPMGGLDFSPIIGLLILNLINSSLVKIITTFT
jgi:YggT family protein